MGLKGHPAALTYGHAGGNSYIGYGYATPGITEQDGFIKNLFFSLVESVFLGGLVICRLITNVSKCGVSLKANVKCTNWR